MSMYDDDFDDWRERERERDLERQRERERFRQEAEARFHAERDRSHSGASTGPFSSGSSGFGSSGFTSRFGPIGSHPDEAELQTDTTGSTDATADKAAGDKGNAMVEASGANVEAGSTTSEEDAAKLVAAEIRKQLSGLLEAYAVFFADYKPILDTEAECKSTEDRIERLAKVERDVPGAQIITSNIEARLANFLAQRKLSELKDGIGMHAQIFGERISAHAAYVSGLNITPDSSAELRALRKQSDNVVSQLRSAVSNATKACAPLPQRSDKEKSRVASRKSKVEELQVAMIEAYDGHQQAKIAYDKIYALSRAMDDYRWHYGIEEPRKPSAEEVLQFLENWTARKAKRLQEQREAYVALADYKRAMSARRKASNKMKEIFYRVPASEKMAFEEERAIVRQAEKVREFLLEDDDHLKLGRYERIERQAPAVESVDKPEQEQELVESLRDQSEMLAYCVGARNFARSDAQKFGATPEPVPPEPGDYDTGNGYAQALREYRKACADRRSVIWRKQSIIEARGIQLEAVVAKLAATIDKCLRLKEATDALLVPYLVGDTLVNMFRKREERRRDDD